MQSQLDVGRSCRAAWAGIAPGAMEGGQREAGEEATYRLLGKPRQSSMCSSNTPGGSTHTGKGTTGLATAV